MYGGRLDTNRYTSDLIQDYARARMWFDIAASQEPDGIAKQFRSKVENLMTPTQIAGAKNLALECKVKNYKGW
jgi:hypothetical protein